MCLLLKKVFFLHDGLQKNTCGGSLLKMETCILRGLSLKEPIGEGHFQHVSKTAVHALEEEMKAGFLVSLLSSVLSFRNPSCEMKNKLFGVDHFSL